MNVQLVVPSEGYGGWLELIEGLTGQWRRTDEEKARIVDTLMLRMAAEVARKYWRATARRSGSAAGWRGVAPPGFQTPSAPRDSTQWLVLTRSPRSTSGIRAGATIMQAAKLPVTERANFETDMEPARSNRQLLNVSSIAAALFSPP